MKRIVFLFSTVLMALPFGLSAQEEVHDLKVMTYNIRFATTKDGPNAWNHRKEASVAMIEDQKPDVFAMQEVLSKQKKFMDKFCTGYQGVGVGRENGKKKGEHTTVHWNTNTVNMLDWGTLWLSETPEKPSIGWDAWHPRTFTWTLLEKKDSGKKFYFINVHLDHAGGQAQRNGLALVKSWIDEKNTDGLPVIIVGDFNVTPTNGILTDFNNVMKNATQHAESVDTHESFNQWGERSLTLDYVFFEGLSKCHSYDVVTEEYGGKTFISDHYPVTAEFTF